jgi:hypothetical protein
MKFIVLMLLLLAEYRYPSEFVCWVGPNTPGILFFHGRVACSPDPEPK